MPRRIHSFVRKTAHRKKKWLGNLPCKYNLQYETSARKAN